MVRTLLSELSVSAVVKYSAFGNAPSSGPLYTFIMVLNCTRWNDDALEIADIVIHEMTHIVIVEVLYTL